MDDWGGFHIEGLEKSGQSVASCDELLLHNWLPLTDISIWYRLTLFDAHIYASFDDFMGFFFPSIRVEAAQVVQ